MPERKLTLADGTVIENAHCIRSEGRLYVYIDGQDDIRTYFDLFMDPGKTATIVETFLDTENVYTGFTELYSISREYGNINVAMQKEST